MLTGLAFPPGEERDTLAALILVKHIRFSEESWRAANFPLQLLDWDGCQPVTLQSAFLFFTDFDFPMHPAAVTRVPSADILYSFFFSPQIPSYQPARDNISLQQQWHKAGAWHHGTTPPSLCQCPRQLLQTLLPPTSLCCLPLLWVANGPVLEWSARCLLAVATLLISIPFDAREILSVSSFPNTHPIACSQGAIVCYDMLLL